MSQYDEGHTVAGWTGTAIATIGATVLGLGVCLVSALLIAGGLGILAVSVLVTWGLHLIGWGKSPGVRPRGQWPMGKRDLAARNGHPDCWSCRLAGRGTRTTVSAAVTATAAGEPEAEAASAR